MNIVQLISKKRDGESLSESEIRWIVAGFARDSIAPEQISALAMAIFFKGMSLEETIALTQAMIDSGKPLVVSNHQTPRIDKHSTGGIGDKISIPLTPLLAELGIHVPMISGRGLGPTGGTLDKMESIPGFRVEIPSHQLQSLLDQHGCFIVGASSELAPADQKLYALRDITGTVPSIPLIVASILSKKLSEGLDGLIMDVKSGNGAFMKSLERAEDLARQIQQVATRLGVPTTTCITDMNQPLGCLIGNACEIAESLEIMEGQGPDDVRQLTIQLAAEALVLSGQSLDIESAKQTCIQKLNQGVVRERFERMVVAQGGNLDELPDISRRQPVLANQSGFIAEIKTDLLGYAIIEMGGGRKQQGDPLNLETGINMQVRLGDPVQEGQAWCEVINFDAQPASEIQRLLQQAIVVSEQPPSTPALIHSIRRPTASP